MNYFSSNDKKGTANGHLRQKRLRNENSLGELTRNFMNFVKERRNSVININELVKKLKVKKRRIYDITNVLEGIGYIKKVAKNQIVWLNQSILDINTNVKLTELSCDDDDLNELENLKKESMLLDNYIEKIKNDFQKLNEQHNTKEYGYVTIEDLKQIVQCDNQNLIAIKAPYGTTIEIPDKESTKEAYNKMDKGDDPALVEALQMKHQLFMESHGGEITVYLIYTEDNL